MSSKEIEISNRISLYVVTYRMQNLPRNLTIVHIEPFYIEINVAYRIDILICNRRATAGPKFFAIANSRFENFLASRLHKFFSAIVPIRYQKCLEYFFGILRRSRFLSFFFFFRKTGSFCTRAIEIRAKEIVSCSL